MWVSKMNGESGDGSSYNFDAEELAVRLGTRVDKAGKLHAKMCAISNTHSPFNPVNILLWPSIPLHAQLFPVCCRKSTISGTASNTRTSSWLPAQRAKNFTCTCSWRTQSSTKKWSWFQSRKKCGRKANWCWTWRGWCYRRRWKRLSVMYILELLRFVHWIVQLIVWLGFVYLSGCQIYH